MRSTLAVTLLLVTAACGSERSYKVGVISQGGGVYNGADIAVRELNGKNGINGTPLRVQRADTAGGSRKDSAKVAEKLASDSAVRFILQQSPGGVPASVLRVYYARGVPVLVAGPVLGKSDGKWVFYLMPSAAEEAKLMAAQAERLWAPKRVAIVHSADNYGVVLSAELKAQIPRSATFVLDTPFADTRDTADIAALERVITSAKADALFWLGPPRVLGVMIARLRQHMPDLRIMGSEAIEGRRLYQNDEGMFNGIVFVRAADPSVDTVRYNKFQYTFQIWMGWPATSDALLAYDVTTMIADAMRKGAVSREQIRDYILSLGRSRPAYNGITGPIAFDSTGVLKRSLGLAEVREDGVKPVPLAERVP